MTSDDFLAALGFHREPWMRDALCREPDHARLDWVPASPTAAAKAQRAVCARCLVHDECLAFALEHDERGIWGGTNEAERRALGREAA